MKKSDGLEIFKTLSVTTNRRIRVTIIFLRSNKNCFYDQNSVKTKKLKFTGKTLSWWYTINKGQYTQISFRSILRVISTLPFRYLILIGIISQNYKIIYYLKAVSYNSGNIKEQLSCTHIKIKQTEKCYSTQIKIYGNTANSE